MTGTLIDVQAEHAEEFDADDADDFADDDELANSEGFDDPEELDDLDEFDDNRDGSSEGKLEAIQMAWVEIYKENSEDD